METTFAGEVDGHIHRNFDYDILGALQREAPLTVFFTQFSSRSFLHAVLFTPARATPPSRLGYLQLT